MRCCCPVSLPPVARCSRAAELLAALEQRCPLSVGQVKCCCRSLWLTGRCCRSPLRSVERLLALVAVLSGTLLSLDGVAVNEMMLLVADVAGRAVLLLLLLEHCATVSTTAPQRNKVVAEPMTRWRTASR
jgi:hypothetical protein